MAEKMNDIYPSQDLIPLVDGFIAKKRDEMCRELTAKYVLSSDEASEIVSTFLDDSYGPAMALAEEIAKREGPVLLFIGRKDCAICQRCRPFLERFILEHKDLKSVILDYSQPEGLLYHLIHGEEKGMLPLIALIFRGKIMMKTCGECAAEHFYEKCYRDIREDCRQNLYVH